MISAIDFSKHISQLTHYFVGREWVFKAINDWLSHPNDSQFFLIIGEPGSGKSSIASRLSQFSNGELTPLDSTSRIRKQFLNAIHFCSGDLNWRNPQVFTGSISIQLSKDKLFAKALIESLSEGRIEININQHDIIAEQAAAMIVNTLNAPGSAADDMFSRFIWVPLKDLFDSGFIDQVVILVDALDEALNFGKINIVSLLAQSKAIPKCVRFIITSRNDDRVISNFVGRDLKILDISSSQFRSYNWKDISIYIEKRLDKDKELAVKVRQLKPEQLDNILKTIIDKTNGNFQYLSFLLDAIANGYQKLEEEEIGKLPVELDALYHRYLENFVEQFSYEWLTYYAPILGILSVAQGRLTQKQLQLFTGQSDLNLRTYLGRLQQFFKPDDKINNEYRYRLYHQSFIDFFRSESITKENIRFKNSYYLAPEEWHKKIVDYYHLADNTKQDIDWSTVDNYGLIYLATHLYALRHTQIDNTRTYRQELYGLISKPFMQEKFTRFGSYRSFADDVELDIEAACSEESPNIAEIIRGSLIYVSLGSLLTSIAPDMLCALANIGQVERAKDYASLIQNPEKRSQAYQLIASAVHDKEGKSSLKLIFNKALEAAYSIDKRKQKSFVLSELAQTMAEKGEEQLATQAAESAVDNAEPLYANRLDSQEADLLLKAAWALALSGNLKKAETIVIDVLSKLSKTNDYMTPDIKWGDQIALLFKISNVFKLAGNRDGAKGILDRAWKQFLPVVNGISSDKYHDIDVPNLARALIEIGNFQYAEEILLDKRTLEDWGWDTITTLSELSQLLIRKDMKLKGKEIATKAASMLEAEVFKAKEKGQLYYSHQELDINTAIISVVNVLARIDKTNEALKIADSIKDDVSKNAAFGAIARSLVIIGKKEKALEIVNRGLVMGEASLKKNTPLKLTLLASIANSLMQSGLKDNAAKVGFHAIHVSKILLDKSFPNTDDLMTVVKALAQIKQYEECLRIAESVKDNNTRFSMLEYIVRTLDESGLKSDVTKTEQKILNMSEEVDHQELIIAELAEFLARLGIIDQALKLANNALDLWKKEFHVRYDTTITTLNVLGRTFAIIGKFAIANEIVKLVDGRDLPWEIWIKTDILKAIVEHLVKDHNIDLARQFADSARDLAMNIDGDYINGEVDPFSYTSKSIITAAEAFVVLDLDTQAKALAHSALDILEERMLDSYFEIIELEHLIPQRISTAKILEMHIDIKRWVVEWTGKKSFGHFNSREKARVLSTVGQILTRTGQREDGKQLIQMALNLSRLSGIDALFETLSNGSSTVAAIDQGKTLWRIYEMMLEVEGWWDRQD